MATPTWQIEEQAVQIFANAQVGRSCARAGAESNMHQPSPANLWRASGGLTDVRIARISRTSFAQAAARGLCIATLWYAPEAT